MPANPAVRKFKGLNNVSDPLRAGVDWLAVADDVHVTDTGALEKREGFTRSMAGSFTGCYSTLDYSRLYVVDGGAMKVMTSTSAGATIATGITAAAMHFTEINDQVFYNNGTSSGIIGLDNSVLPWAWTKPSSPALAAVTGALEAGLYRVFCTFLLADGRETGASEQVAIELLEGQAIQISAIPACPTAGGVTKVYIQPANSSVCQLAFTTRASALVWNSPADTLGADLETINLDPLPLGCDVIQAWRGRIYAVQYLPSLDQSVIWFSKSLGFHLFNLAEDFIMVPGRALMLAPHDDALIIGTDKRIHAYDGEKISPLADYGVVPGWHWAKDDAVNGAQRVVFWTTRGVCAALPFTNLTADAVSVAPGVSAGGAMVRSNGQKRFVVALQAGGSAFNQR